MLNPVYHFEKLREVLDEFQPSRELSLARTKLEECELWLSKCHPRTDALMRDQVSAPASSLGLVPDPNQIDGSHNRGD
jgi:hypothetical protein